MALKGQNTARTKQLNKSLVLQTLLRYGPISRQEIAETTHLTRATITYITSELIEEGLVWETGNLPDNKPGAGRKSVALDLKGDSCWVIGVHARMDYTTIGLVNLKGKVERVYKKANPQNLNAAQYLEFLVNEIQNYMNENHTFTVTGIGIGASGLIDLQAGKILGNEHLEWPDINLVSHLSASLNLPVFLDNNVNAMALAEKMFGQSKMLSDFICVYIGQEIGGGLVLKDELYRSGITGAAEFGHMTYLPDGKPCWCGNNGCLTKYGSESAIIEELNRETIQEVVDAADQGDPDTLKILEKAGERIASVLVSFINMLHVERVVICGTFGKENYPMTNIIRKEINQRSFLAKKQKVEVAPSQLGEEIEVIGAGGLALLYGVYQSSVK